MIDSPDDEHTVARNMQSIGINKYKKKELGVELVIYKEL